ncbi:hypothetical protein [Chamaesiphon sp.]
MQSRGGILRNGRIARPAMIATVNCLLVLSRCLVQHMHQGSSA